MTKVKFTIAAHNQHDEECEWYAERQHEETPLIPEAELVKFFDSNPLYEVTFEVEYDTETTVFKITSADAVGAEFRPNL